MRHLNIPTGIKVPVLLWEEADGWHWKGEWENGPGGGGLRSRTEAMDAAGLHCGERYLWPEFYDR